MNFEEFKEYVKDHILEYLPESYSAAKVTIQSVVKNNDWKLDGLTVRNEHSNISPNIYLNQFFRDYEDGKLLAIASRLSLLFYDPKTGKSAQSLDLFSLTVRLLNEYMLNNHSEVSRIL